MTTRSHIDSSLTVSVHQKCMRRLIAFLLLTSLGTVQSGDVGAEDASGPPLFEVTAVDYAFQAPDTIPSGWVTFRMRNRGEETHYFLLDRLPEGRTFEDYRDEILPVFESMQEALNAPESGNPAKTVARLARTEFPDWSKQSIPPLPYAGGVGLTGPGEVGQTTVRLEPGQYVLSCFLMTPDEAFHGVRGMVQPVTVTDESSGASPPSPDVVIKRSGQHVTIAGNFTAGEQTVAISVEESPDEGDGPYEYHLARLAPDVDLHEVATWNESGFQNPAPATFLGGAEGVPAGETAYVTVDLKAGRYAWFAYHQEETLIKEFAVE